MRYKVGDKVKKITGDYAFDGTVVAAFSMLNGAERYVVEHDDCHMLHIFSDKNLALADSVAQ
jgi:hypothetical protein